MRTFHSSIVFLLFCFFTLIDEENCSSILLNHLRRDRTILMRKDFTSSSDHRMERGSKLNLTCSFLSNFDAMDIFWLHNGKLIQSFLSQKISSKNLDEKRNSSKMLMLTMISTLSIDSITDEDEGYYQCIGAFEHLSAQQTFHLQIDSNENKLNESKKNSSRPKPMITVHPSEILFESDRSIRLMCRTNENQCEIRWFNPNDQFIENSHQDLFFSNETSPFQIGFYTCRICCSAQCQHFQSFIYPTEPDE